MEGDAANEGRGDTTGRSRAGVTDDLLTTSEVSTLFGVDRRTVVLWANRGRFRALRTPGGQYRFRANEVRRLVESSNSAKGMSAASE